MITQKLPFSYFHDNYCQRNKFLHENNACYQAILCLKKWSQTDQESSRKVVIKVHILFHIVMTKTAATGLIQIKSYFSVFLNNICHIPEWISLILKNSLFFKISLMASLNILYSDPYNFLKEVTKKKGKYIRKFFVAHQKFWKVFHDPYKNPRGLLSCIPNIRPQNKQTLHHQSINQSNGNSIRW